MIKLLITAFLLPLYLSASWSDRKAEGWVWHEESGEKVSEEQSPPPKTSQDSIKEIKRDLEEKLAKAILEPTEENLKNYITQQKYLVDKSGEFSKAWARFILENPDLDQTIQTPVSQYGIQIHKKKEEKKRQQLLSALSKKFGLFFFFKGEQLESKALSKVVKLFSEQYSWEVLAISIDGIKLKDFPEARVSSDARVKITPSIFLVSPDDNYMVPIGSGLITVEQIEKNILMQFTGKS